MKIKIHFFLVILFASSVTLSAQDFKAGAALRKITPEKLIPISGGMGTPVMPTGKQGDLFVRALVLEKGSTRVAIVSIDNLGWPAYLGDRSRKLIKGIPAENILIGATHAHSAPDAYGFPDEKGNTGADLSYLDWCVAEVADAVNEAIEKLEPAALKTAVGVAKGKIAYNYYAEKLYDPRCGVIQAITSSGKTIATLVNYASHPEILGTDRKTLSPDFCGPLYERIEEKTGGIAIYMNSAQGGMVTADTRIDSNVTGGKENNDWNECIRIGNLLADEALRIIEKVPVTENPELTCNSKMFRFPVDNQVMRFVFKNSPVAGNAAKNMDFTSVLTQVNFLSVGKAKILTIPGEALPNIGYYLKRKMNTEQPFLFGLTNDAFGYILTKEDFDSFERYKYITRTSLGEMTGEIFEQEALKLMNESQYSGVK